MKKELQRRSAIIRGRTIWTSHTAGIPHLASCLSCTDLLVYIYGKLLQIDPTDPHHEDRDRFILSKGHAAPVLFQVLAEHKFFDLAQLQSFGKDGSLFGEHPPAHGIPGIEVATGSLGHGLPIGIGFALSAKLRAKKYKTIVLLGDGECNEGTIWEGALFAPTHQLDNLTVVVDYNKWQATARSNETMSIASLSEKFTAFGWNSIEIDGHNFEEIDGAFHSQFSNNKPTAIIAHTIKGKGVSFMEDDNNWHYRKPNTKEVEQSFLELGISKEDIVGNT